MTGNEDPRTREKIENLDEISVDDVLTMASLKMQEMPQKRTPHREVVDTEYGVEAVFDTQGTRVNPDSVTYAIEDGGDQIRIYDPDSRWYSTLQPSDPDETITGADVEQSGSGMVNVQVVFESEGGLAGVDEESEDSSAPSSAEEEDVATPLDGGDLSGDLEMENPPTLTEAYDTFPWFRELLEGVLGTDRVGFLLDQHGDTPIPDLPFDMTDEEEIQGAVEGAGEGFDWNDEED